MSVTQHLNEPDAFGPAFIEMSSRLGRYDATTEEAEAIVRLLELAPGASVLDAGCGFGRTAGALARIGVDATGVDISPVVIEQARKHNPGPDYVVHDLTQPLPDGVGPFDAVVNVYSSFGYGATIADDLAVLRTWRAALVDGGKLVMELSDLERSRHRLGPPGTVADRDDNGVHEHLYVDPQTSVLHVRYSFGDTSLDVDTRLYEADELVSLVRQAGFADIQRYGGFDRRAKSPEDRLVLTGVAA
ncbi:MAG TPA: class I SAM-dependent methyltransferase [Conexibacter sp.]|jgi:SAM-dependent methyltransferase